MIQPHPSTLQPAQPLPALPFAAVTVAAATVLSWFVIPEGNLLLPFALASLFVIPGGNLLLPFASAAVRIRKPTHPCRALPLPSLLSLPACLLLLLALATIPAFAATKKKPTPHAHAPATHRAPPRATAKHPPKPKSSSARRHPPSPKRPSARFYPPDNAIAATPTPRPDLAEAPATNPFTNLHALDPFFRALAAHQSQAPDTPNTQSSIPTLAATVRILQFGDSHTAADLFTGSLRAQLQSRFGNGGLGFQFPGHPFPGYHLAGSTRSQTSGWLTEGNKFTQLGDGDLGLGGISLSTTRPGESISLTTTCTTLQVHYLRQPEGGHLHFTDNGTFISDIDTSAPDPPAPAIAGYPPTDPAPPAPERGPGTLTYACTPGDHTFELTTLDRAPVRLLGLVTEQPGITYECLGINGAVAPLMLRWNQTLFAEYLRQRAPALIVLAYGTNEAAQSPGSNEEYVAQFHRLLGNLHRIVPAAAILVLGPYDRALRTGRGRRAAWRTFAGTDRIIADQKAACRQDLCAFYDERARMGGPGAMVRWVSAGLAQADRTHLTGPGYRTLAEALFRDLMAAYTTFRQGDAGPLALSRRRGGSPHPASLPVPSPPGTNPQTPYSTRRSSSRAACSGVISLRICSSICAFAFSSSPRACVTRSIC